MAKTPHGNSTSLGRAMRAKKIIFPTDFSHSSDAALPFASSLAQATGATLLIVHVEEPPMAYGGGEMYYGIPNPVTEDLRAMLQRVQPTEPDVPHEHHLIVGNPAVAISELARTEGADLIVMGTHGRTGLRRLLMGSVAEAIVRRAPCPVFIMKEPQEE